MTTLAASPLVARVPDPMAAPMLKWGILGTGWIAERFVASLRRSTVQQVVAVGSRQPTRADRFALEHDLPRAHGSYEALVSDDELDVVYVATTHESHASAAKLALRAGKHVLVEKPLALNAREGADIVRAAGEAKLFAMEALWTLFLPKFDVVRQVLDGGVLGEVRTVLAEYGVHFEADHRIMKLELGGGPLLDLGTYPVSLVTWALGEPVSIVAQGQDHPLGVNGQVSAMFEFEGGAQGLTHTTLFSATPTTAVIAGTACTLELSGPFFQPGDVGLRTPGGDVTTLYTEPKVGHAALCFEAAEVARCVTEGRLESQIRPLSASMVTMRCLDEIRRQCAINFPSESS